MFKKLRDSFRGKTKESTRDRLCAHLINLGIDAELVKKGASEDLGTVPLGRMGRFLKGEAFDVGSIRVTGKDIDVVQVNRYVESGAGKWYEIDYAVKGHVKGDRERSVTAKTKVKRKGLYRRQAVDFTWVGGEIADLLNGDQSLKELMLQEQLPHIEIKPDKEKPYVRIHQDHILGDSKHFWSPSEKVFECYNRIAKHIRQLLQ